MARELYTWEMGDPPLECVYHLPSSDTFKTVNASVFYALSRMYPGQRIARDETDGAIVYNLFGRGWRAQLFVLYTTDCVATVRAHALLPNDPIERIVWIRDVGSIAGEELVALFQICHASIANLLRGAAFTLGPPRVPTDLTAALTWQEVYFPAMPDSELSNLTGYEGQTIRNKRRELGKRKKTRGKKQ